MNSPASSTPPSVWPYVLRFALSFLLLSLAALALMLVLRVVNYYAWVALCVMTAALIAARTFLKDHGRYFSRVERRQLVLGSWLCFIALNFLIDAAFFVLRPQVVPALLAQVRAHPLAVVAGLLASYLLLGLAPLVLAYGLIARRIVRRLVEAGRLPASALPR